MTDLRSRDVLPIPDRPYQGELPLDAKDAGATFPAIEPLPPKVPPETLTSPACDPLMRSVPSEMFVAPVKLLVPLSTSVPAAFLVSEPPEPAMLPL